ncbi:MAG: rhodanese-like domain-containing protein [Chloroflexota bacterium]
MAAIPEITVQTLAAKLRSEDQFVLLDVRELWELESARIADHRLVIAPMSSLSQLGLPGLPEAAQSPEADVFVLCHHGVRSAQVTAWLSARGWTRAFSVSGGIDEYARKVDSSVGSY